ncbi:hypothetical protein HDU79_000012 [Rhizoclosmatium sp. JEL0117]|nr:hypothetical protein HDU79_000012 [Rhizoclosmatium sp. JEL0117]
MIPIPSTDSIVAPTPQTVLVALDPTSPNEHTLRWVLSNLVKTERDVIVIITVIATEADREQTENALNTLVSGLPLNTMTKPVPVILTAPTSSIGPRICAAVTDMNPSVLALGSSRNLSSSEASITNYCLANADCKVVVVRNDGTPNIDIEKLQRNSSARSLVGHYDLYRQQMVEHRRRWSASFDSSDQYALFSL